MWVLLWIVLSAILIGASLWSLQILLRQKKAWEEYARARNLSFKRGTFMGPAEITGQLGDYKVSFFTAQQAGTDMRSRRYVTAMELELSEGFVDGGAAGTQEMVPFMQGLEKIHPYKVDYPDWDAAHHMFVKYDDVTRAYFTPERYEALTQILKTRNAEVIVLFNDASVVLHAETSDPMQDAQKIDKIVKRLTALCDRLRISNEERRALMALAAPAETETAAT